VVIEGVARSLAGIDARPSNVVRLEKELLWQQEGKILSAVIRARSNGAGKSLMLLNEEALQVFGQEQGSWKRLWASSPLTLYAVRFASRAKSATDQALREALSLSLERKALARVLLQRQAEPAESLLPQWLSGYASLFDEESNLERAKAIRASLPATAVGVSQPLQLSIDSSNDLLRLIGERVAVNARAAGLTVQIVSRSGVPAAGDGATTKMESEAQLVRWRYTSLSSREALESEATAWR
jgi:hypothetical protein